MNIIKKDGTLEEYDYQKIINAVHKASQRVMIDLSNDDYSKICDIVWNKLIENGYDETDNIDIYDMHNIVEASLEEFNPKIAKQYKEYRNYKKDFVHMLDKVYTKSQSIRYIGDNSNANTDSALVPTQRSLIYNELNSELYNKFFLNVEERQAIKDGYIYIHDKSARLDTINCCLFDMSNVLHGGFEMGNVWYNEPKTLDVAFDVISDVTMSASACQYGGFTIPRVDTLLDPYAKKSYEKYKNEYRSIIEKYPIACLENELDDYATKKVYRDMEQGFQSWEYKYNTVGSSRGDYPFIAITFGIGTSKFEKMATEVILKVRMGGQGKNGFKRPVLFPKLTFLYDESLHGEGKELEHLFDLAIECSSKCMYPDFLSLTGEGYIPSIYKKYGKVISLMGCVDGKEIITYKINDILYVESFERAWNRLSNIFEIQEQDVKGNYFINLKDVKIYDTNKKSFVDCKKIIKNKDKSDWTLLKFTNGRSLLCTQDHPLPIINKGRTFVKDIKIGDEVKICNYSYSEETIQENIDKAWLLGFILCNGCYDNQFSSSIAFYDEDDIKDKYIKTSKDIFDADIKVIEWHRDIKGDYKELKCTDTQKIKEISMYLQSKFCGLQKNNRHIPSEVFSWDKNSKLSFLAGMIDADGYINNSKKTPRVQIGSTNKELALQQMYLAQTLGMSSQLYLNHYTSKDRTKIRYRVEFVPCEELINFIVCKKKILHYTYKNEKIKSNNESKVKAIEFIGNMNKYSYDVTTDSDMFDVSGICSHNCRASLSPWFEKGGMYPLDDTDTPIFEGRCNLGAISLHLPMILAKSRQESKDFYEVLDYYLELIRNLHIKTYDFLGEKKASTNPLAYCQGGFYGGNLKPDEKIRPLLAPMTMSFGITALNELQVLYNGKTLVEDGEFALEVMKYINNKLEIYKKEDNILYAVYGTPAESLSGLQVEQFRKKYGIVKGVSDKSYVSNSFHCHVSEDITPIQKQDLENRFWDLFNGGKIQYCRYPINYNIKAIKTIVKRSMKYGFYEGVNLSLAYCENCGYEQLEMDVCPKCGSGLITKIDRMNGYLGYTKIHGKTRYNNPKNDEIKDRKSM